jgi:hypothetical protein
VAKGPPPVLMRMLVAPLVVASTLALFGSGVLLVLLPHPHGGVVLGLHKASFVVWFGAMAVHVLGHVLRLPALAGADLVHGAALPGARLRAFLIAAALVAGAIVAVVALPSAHEWAHWAAVQHEHDR